MFKITLFLCVALFAASSRAGLFSNPLESAQDTVNGLIERTVQQVQSVVSEAKKKAGELTADLENKAKEYQNKITANVNSKLDEALKEIERITGAAGNVNVSDCALLGRELRKTAFITLVEVRQCFIDKRKKSYSYLHNMLGVANNVLDDLVDYRAQAKECVQNIDGIFSIGKAITCTNMVAARATWSTMKAVPLVAAEAAKLMLHLSTLPATLTKCTTTHALAVLSHQFTFVVRRVAKCVEQKMDEAQAKTTEKPADTTPEPTPEKPVDPTPDKPVEPTPKPKPEKPAEPTPVPKPEKPVEITPKPTPKEPVDTRSEQASETSPESTPVAESTSTSDSVPSSEAQDAPPASEPAADS